MIVPTQTAAPPRIAFAHVGKRFDGGRGAEPALAVDDVSLEVADGEFLAIVGSSGSGKTTLLRLANRLIEADAGSITVEGENVRAVDPVQLRRRVGYVFQSAGLFPHMNVAANIGIAPKLLGGRQRRRLPRGWMSCSTWCGSIAPSYRDRFPHELSAASASASASPARWPQGRGSC